MSDRKTLQAKRISGHSGASPGFDMQRDAEVCKLIDTTICIGCKACEVACVEWNDTHREDGTIQWLMRKDQCMHCADPGCLAACPADGAIVQYTNGIVDFQQANCIGCGYCITGCPFDIPKMNPKTHRVFKCTLCTDRVSEGLEPACIKSCPTGCLHFGSKDEMKFLAEISANM